MQMPFFFSFVQKNLTRHYCKITLTPNMFSSSTLALLDVFFQTVDRATMAPAPRVRGLALN